jgi:D-alanine-D-alanine ligase
MENTSRSRRRLRVAVLVCDPNSPLKGRGEEEYEYVNADESDANFVRSLEESGYEVSWHPAHLDNLDEVVGGLDCDVVFNLCDGSGRGRDNSPGVEAIETLERHDLPYTGSRAEPYRISVSKVAMKERFVAHGVPTARWQLFFSPDEALLEELKDVPLIVKPHDTGGSAGIHLDSIIEAGDEDGLRDRVKKVFADFGSALVEEYIDGREITVGLLGSGERARALPPLEVRFGEEFPKGKGIRTHETKWDASSPLYSAFQLLCPAPLTLAETRRVLRVAREAYRSIEGAGFGRVDIRLDPERGPFVLEVNMNCSLEFGEAIADCGMYAFAAEAAGIPYPALLRRMVEDARRIHAKQHGGRTRSRTRNVASLQAARERRRRR